MPWCDKKVCFSHFASLGQIVEDSATDGTKFFFSLPVSQNPKLTVVPHSATGDFCFREAIRRGYKRIYMIGIEADYVAAIPESRGLTEDEWRAYGSGMLDDLPDSYRTTIRVITETPKRNPNYFFEGYQRAGDHYTLALAAGHLRGWDSCARLAQAHGIDVINLSPISAIPHFPKKNMRSLWTKMRLRRQIRWQAASLTERLRGPLLPISDFS